MESNLCAYGWFLAAVQVFGAVAALLARLSVGSTQQRSCQSLFLLALPLVGLTIMAQLALETCSCVLSGCVIALMVLITTCDFSHHGSRVAE